MDGLLGVAWGALKGIFWNNSPNALGYTVSTGSGVYYQVEYKDMCVPVSPKNCQSKKIAPYGMYKWTTESVVLPPNFMDKVHDKKQEIKSKMTQITEDNNDLCVMVKAGKHGEWMDVFDILDKKPHLINAIPKERAWSVLHQAVYLNNIQSVQKLLSYKNCDVTVKAKRDRAECGQPGDTPLELAEKLNRDQIVAILKNHQTSIPQQQAVPTFISADIGEGYIQDGVPYFLLSLAFLEKSVVQKIYVQDMVSFLDLTEKIYKFLLSNWRYARNCVSECLYPFNIALYNSLKDTTSCHEFLKEMIGIYTSDDVYRQVNEALRRASLKLEPTGDDMLLCLYSLFLQAILLHFDDIDCFEGTSYRGIQMKPEQVQKYKRGKKFVWLQFVSSSKTKSYAIGFGSNVLFIINNQGVTKSSPREINSCSRFGCENEVLYPAGSEFEITKVESQNGTHIIYMDLLHAYKKN